jgi:hypothetical protein
LDSEVLVQEARRRGVTVSDAELADFLGPDAPPSPLARDLARRDFVIQKLRESTVRSEVRVDEARVEAWLAAHPAPADPSRRPAANASIRLLSGRACSNEIVSRKLTLDQAQSAYGADAQADLTQEPDLGAFPDHIAVAIRALAPGQVSQPLPFESSVLLFLLDRPEPVDRGGERRDCRARDLAAESQRIADELLARLKSITPIVRHRTSPFPYVAEAPVAHAE